MEAHDDIVYLEMYEPWRIWRGYQCSGWELCYGSVWFDNDALDDTLERFEHKLLFPNIKPNFDVVLPPTRTRKQRGWYQITRHPAHATPTHMTSHALATIPSTVLRVGAYATAEDLPEELLLHVAASLDDLNGTAVDKHVYATLSRVCSSWAPLLQRHLFSKITVNSRDDVMQLLRFVREPLSRTRDFVAEIVVRPSPSASHESAVPFLHLLPQLAQRLTTTSLKKTHISLIGPLSHGTGSARSIFGDLPRSLPRQSTRGITSLAVEDVSFRSFQELESLVLELIALEYFYAKRLTWPVQTVEASMNRRDRGRRRSAAHTVSLTDCTAQWPVIVLLCNPLAREDCELLRVVLELVENGYHIDKDMMTSLSGVRQTWSTQLDFSLSALERDMPPCGDIDIDEICEAFVDAHQLTLTVNIDASDTQRLPPDRPLLLQERSCTAFIQSLVMEWGIRNLKSPRAYDWSAVDRLLSSRPDLQYVEMVGWDTDSSFWNDRFKQLSPQNKLRIFGSFFHYQCRQVLAITKSRIRTTWIGTSLALIDSP